MKILYLSQSFPPEPGATARPLKQAISLQRLGHDVTVVTSMPFYPFGRIYPGYRWKLFQRESMDGVHVFRIWSFPAPNVGVVRRLLSYSSFAALSMLAGLLQPQLELVISSVPNPGTDLAGIVIAWLRSARCLVEFRDFVADSLALVGHSPDGLLVSIASMYQRMVCRLADLIAVPNKSMVDLLYRRGVPPERVVYLPHAADPMPSAEPQIVDAIRKAMVEGDWFLALYAGTFGRYYRLDTLVQAARIISRQEEHVKLVLLGTGTERARIEQIIQLEGLTTLGLAGPVAPDDVAPYLEAANLLIASLNLTNHEPGSGFLYTKDCQYHLAGKPIIAVEPRPRLKLILEAIDAGTGVAMDDAEGLAQALLWYASHPDEAARRGRNGREYAKRYLMRDDIVRAFDQDLRLHLQLRAVRRQVPYHKRRLMRVNAWIRKHVFSKPRLARWIFGVRVTAPPALQSYWEWPTLWQRIIVGQYLRNDSRVLEVGTGAHAILATYIKRNWPDADVLATDILPDRVESARRTIAANQIVVRCIESDLFSNVDGQYNLILSNLPQTCTSDLAAMGYNPLPEAGLGAPLCWSSDGGEDGMAVIRPFLKACPGYLRGSGRVLMAISPTHVDRARLRDEILQAGMRIERVHRLPFVNSIYALVPASERLERRPRPVTDGDEEGASP
jgi:colanic acid biosynthesis glycosyl transferase WcaI